MDKKINNYIVYGRVQGVGFRRFVLKCANECSIGGWVKNCPDGSVEIQAVGNSSEISCFISRVSEGNWFSDVENIELIFSMDTNDASGEFRIIR